MTVLQAVESRDVMAVDRPRIPLDVLATMRSRNINKVWGVNRVVYEISSEPSATIERD